MFISQRQGTNDREGANVKEKGLQNVEGTQWLLYKAKNISLGKKRKSGKDKFGLKKE